MDLRSELEQHLGTAYRLDRELGGGGMSRVFVAEDTRLHRQVVVKVLSPELAQGINVERFEREIQLAASLQQANIVPLHSAGDLAGLPYFTMPFVEGESLRARLARGPLPIGEVIAILRDVTKALAYAHGRGVVHRDIKPDNVLLSGGTAVVTDFGIAKAISASRTDGAEGGTLTQLGTSIGTPAYMAPEQVVGDPKVDQRVDLYALGCMAFELLTGRQPFADRPAPKMLAAHLTETPPAVATLRPDCPPELAALVERLMAKDPDQRPANASALLTVLEAPVTTSGASISFGAPGMLKKAMLWYVVSLIAVAIVAKAAVVGIGLPDWVFPGAILVMALGLPALLATAYVQRVARHAATATPTLTPGGTSVAKAPSGTMATMALKASPHLTWKRATKAGYIAIGVFVLMVAGFMIFRALGIGPWGSLFAEGKLAVNDKLVIADFAVTQSDSALGPILVEAVRTALSQSRSVHLVAPAGVADVLQQMKQPRDSRLDGATAREVAARAGATAVLGGRLARSGGDYAVSLDLTSARDGSTLASVQGTASGLSGLLKVIDKLTRKLRGEMGESLKDVQHAVPLERATTSSLTALRKYSEAVRANDVDMDYDRAVRAGREAVALDSTFALAWRKLAVSLYAASYSSLSVDSALSQAVKYSDRLPEREKYLVMGAYYGDAGSSPDRGKAVAAYQHAYAVDSGDLTAIHDLANAFIARGQGDSALRYAEREYALTTGPTAAGNFAWNLALAGRPDSARHVIETQLAGDSNSFYAVLARYYTSLADGDRDAALRTVTRWATSADSATRLFALGLVTAQLSTRGQLARAITTDSENLHLLALRGTRPDVQHLTEAEMDIRFRGRPADGVRLLEQAIASPAWQSAAPVTRPYTWAATMFALAGRPERAQAMLDEFRREGGKWAAAPDSQSVIADVSGEIALAEGKYQDALRDFRKGHLGPDGFPVYCAACADYNLGRVYDRMGESDSAIAHFGAYLASPPSTRDFNDATALAGIQKRLGELYDAKGDTAGAVKHYGAFTELWKDADPDLQPVVQTVKKRLGELAAR
jgi:tetratricopeptide (TPR) repeat protein/tRNA A-37 threonylcarbamoyl transferase component Bud32